MTPLQDLTDLDPAVAGEYAERNITLVPSAEAPALSGALSSIGFSAPGSDGPAPATIAVMAEAGMDLFDVVVAATQAANPDLVPTTALSVASINELEITQGPPIDLYTLMHEGAVAGVLIHTKDRRKAGGAASTAGPDVGGATGPGVPAPAEPAPFQQPTYSGGPAGGAGDLTMLRDVMLDVTVELGRESLTLAQLTHLTVGSVVELDRPAGAPVDIRVNGILFGRGEVVVVDDEYAVRVVEIIENSESPR